MRKTLPIADGGALLGPLRRGDRPRRPPHRWKIWRREGIRSLEAAVDTLGWPNPYPALDKLRSAVTAGPAPEETFDESLPSSQFRSWLASPSALGNIIATRKANFEALAHGLSQVGGPKPLFQVLGGDDVPQVFPLRPPDPSLLPYLRRRGIGAVSWPGRELPAEVAADTDRFRVANEIAQEVIGLPLHQDLGSRDIETILNEVARWMKAGG